MEVLNHIDQKNLLPPLMVVEALSRNATTTLAVIKVRSNQSVSHRVNCCQDYIVKRLQQEDEVIKTDKAYAEQVSGMYVLCVCHSLFQDAR